MAKELTIKQRLFIRKYLQYGNATEAAMTIYNTKSRRSAAVIGSRLLRNVNVRREIDRIVEAEGSIPAYIAKLLVDVIENGSWKEKIKAIQIALKLHGVY